MPPTYFSYVRDTFTLLLNTPLAESKSSTLPPAFPMKSMSLERRSSLDPRTTANSAAADASDVSTLSSYSRTSSRSSGSSR